MHIRQHSPLYDIVCLTKQPSFKTANDMTSESATSTMTYDVDCNRVLWDAHNCICLCREPYFFQQMRDRPCSSNNQAHLRFEKVWALLATFIPEVFRQAAEIVKTGVKHVINLNTAQSFWPCAIHIHSQRRCTRFSLLCYELHVTCNSISPASSPLRLSVDF